MEHNDFKRCDIKEKFLNPKITRRFLFLFTFTFQKKKEQQKYNSQQRMIFFVENRLGRAFEKSVLRAFQKSVCILISVYRKESKRVQNFSESSEKLRKVLECSEFFWTLSYKQKSISKRSSKTLLKRSSMSLINNTKFLSSLTFLVSTSFMKGAKQCQYFVHSVQYRCNLHI